jgi:hypothetical protein
MDSGYWRRALESPMAPSVRLVAPSPLSSERRRAVATLLAQYAGGESAEALIAHRLLAGAADADDRAALRRLLDDEERHAGLLAETVRYLGGGELPRRPEVERLVRVIGPLGFLEVVGVFHLLEVCVATAYRHLRAANRDDPALRAVLGAILRDEAVHCAFHRARLAEAARTAGRLRRASLRVVHLLARRWLVTGERSVAAPEVYETAMGIPVTAFRARLWRTYQRAYDGDLAWLSR